MNNPAAGERYISDSLYIQDVDVSSAAFNQNFQNNSVGNGSSLTSTFRSVLSLSITNLSFLPRLFAITTNTGSYYFTTELLASISPVIQKRLEKNPQKLEFHIAIDDDIVMKKFEALFQFAIIEFTKSELLVIQKVISALRIERCPRCMLPSKSPEQISALKSTFYVQLPPATVIKVLQNASKTFNIVSEGHTLACNSLGVHSSKVIHNALQNNPEINQISLNFNLENPKDILLIQSLFNFVFVDINANNMDFLEAACHDLEIECVYGYIEQFKTNYSITMKAVESKQILAQPINDLFASLYSINAETVRSVCDSILKTEFVHGEDNIQELVACFLQVIRTKVRIHSEILDLVILLDQHSDECNDLKLFIPFLQNHLLAFRNKPECYSAFLYKMTKRGIIPLDTVLRNLLKHYIRRSNLRYMHNSEFIFEAAVLFFLPEFVGKFKRSAQMLQINQDLVSLLDNHPDQYIILRDTLEPLDPLSLLILHDNVDELQSALSNGNIDINLQISPATIFDYISNGTTREQVVPYVNGLTQNTSRRSVIGTMSLIDYTAQQGSINCFKYLYLSHANITLNLFSYAVQGCNSEIIRIAYDKLLELLADKQKETHKRPRRTRGNAVNKCEDIDSIYFNALNHAISLHQYTLFDWILERVAQPTHFTLNQLAVTAAINGNAYVFSSFYDKELDIENCLFNLSADCQTGLINNPFVPMIMNGYYHLIKFVLELTNSRKINPIVISNLSPETFVQSNNISLFRLLCENKNTHGFNVSSILYQALANDCFSMVDYIYDNFHYPGEETDYFGTYTNSLLSSNIDMFNHVQKRYPLEKSTQYMTIHDYVEIITYASSVLHLEAVDKLTDHLLTLKKDVDFTSPFMQSCFSGSNSLIELFIEKKVKLNLFLISETYELFLFSHGRAINKLIDMATETNRKQISFLFLMKSIQARNIEITKQLIETNKPNALAFAAALDACDAEMVKLLMQYMDPKILMETSPKSPFIYAITKTNNLDIVNLFIDYYDDSIKDYEEQINIAIKILLESYIRAQNPPYSPCSVTHLRLIPNNIKMTPNQIEIMKRLDEVVHIDWNCNYNNKTFLMAAIEINDIEFVKFSLEKLKNTLLVCKAIPESPIVYAIRQCQLDLVDLFIDFYGDQITEQADEINNELKSLFERIFKGALKGLNVFNKKDFFNFVTRFYERTKISLPFLNDLISTAIRSKNIPFIKFYLKNLKDKSILSGNNPNSPFLKAIIALNLEIVDIFIDYFGSTIIEQTDQINMALKKTMKFIFNDRFIVNEERQRKGFIDVFTRLASFVDLNLNVSYKGTLFIYHAIERCLPEVVQFYLDNTKDKSLLTDQTQKSPFYQAIVMHKLEIIDIFIKYYDDKIEEQTTAVNLALQAILEKMSNMAGESSKLNKIGSKSQIPNIFRNYEKAIEKVASVVHVDLNITYKTHTFLTLFILANQPKFVRFYLQYVDDHSIFYDKSKDSPLIFAIKARNSELIDIFIDFFGEKIVDQMDQINIGLSEIFTQDYSISTEYRPGIDIELQNRMARLLLDGIVGVVRRLSEVVPIDPNIVSKGVDILMAAILVNHPLFVQLFLQFAKEAPVLTSTEVLIQAPLVYAIRQLRIGIVDQFLKYYGDKLPEHIDQINFGLKQLLQIRPADPIHQRKYEAGELDEDQPKEKIDPNVILLIRMLSTIPNIDFNCYAHNETFLTLAISQGDVQWVQILLQIESVDVNLCELTYGNSPLMLSIFLDYPEIAELLIECPRIDTKIRNYFNETALLTAISKTNGNDFNLVIKKLMNSIDQNQLDYAFYLSNDEIAQQLISANELNINYIDMEHGIQAKTISREMIENPDSSSLYLYQSTLLHSILTEQFKKAELIVNHPKFDPFESNAEAAIFVSIEKHNLTLFNRLLDFVDINLINQNCETLISNCCKFDFSDGVSRILNDKKFDIVKTHFYDLLLSLLRGRIVSGLALFQFDIIKQVVEYDDSISHLLRYDQLLPTGKSFFTQICIASAFSGNDLKGNNPNELSVPVIQFLLEKGVDPNKPDAFGVYPLEYAILNSSYCMVKTLLDSGKIDPSIKLNAPNIINGNYLQFASLGPSPMIVEEILSRRMFNINDADDLGEPPILKACFTKNEAVIRALLEEKDIDLHIRNKNGEDFRDLIENYRKYSDGNSGEINRFPTDQILGLFYQKEMKSGGFY